MRKFSLYITVFALLLCAAVYAAQDTTIDPRQVRDPKQLETWLEANASDVESRLTVKGNSQNATTNITLTSANYGTVVMVTSNAAVAVTLPANGAAAGSYIDIMTGAGSTDSCAPTISAATTDTLVGPNDQDLKSVTWATGHRINAYARFISDGSFWHVQNLGGTTMTYTD